MTSDFDRLNQSMTEAFQNGEVIYHPSDYWRHLNDANNKQLDDAGIINFKRTVVKNYFTWMRILPWDPQIVFLVRELGFFKAAKAIVRTFFPMKHRHIPLAESLALNFLTHLVWQFAKLKSPELVNRLSEPEIGNPPRITSEGRLISQDIANSALEFDAMNFEGRLAGAKRVCELGGGYGRTTFVVATLRPDTQCIMVDIPPALAVAESYMTEVFPDRRIFGFRPFENFDEVREEFEEADLVFLLPHQLALLPDSYIDYFFNISSLHEMYHEQIRHYTKLIFRLVAPGGHFFLKAWKISKIPFDEIEVRYEDYGLDDWNQVYHRTSEIQTRFFETLLQRPSQ